MCPSLQSHEHWAGNVEMLFICLLLKGRRLVPLMCLLDYFQQVNRILGRPLLVCRTPGLLWPHTSCSLLLATWILSLSWLLLCGLRLPHLSQPWTSSGGVCPTAALWPTCPMATCRTCSAQKAPVAPQHPRPPRGGTLSPWLPPSLLQDLAYSAPSPVPWNRPHRPPRG